MMEKNNYIKSTIQGLIDNVDTLSIEYYESRNGVKKEYDTEVNSPLTTYHIQLSKYEYETVSAASTSFYELSIRDINTGATDTIRSSEFPELANLFNSFTKSMVARIDDQSFKLWATLSSTLSTK